MGQKTHPTGFRLGVIRTWDSRWFREKGYADWLAEDMKIRAFIHKTLKGAAISRIDIERASTRCKVLVHAGRVGVVYGKKGSSSFEQLKKDLQKLTQSEVVLLPQDVQKPEQDAQLVAEGVCQQLERRAAFRRVMKRSIQTAQKVGAKGIRIAVSGRLGGAEIARREWYREGRVPLHTLRADIEYGFAQAYTTYGVIGCKCWIFKGEVLPRGVRRGA
jgi:small subunit ribosomal protein S3